MKIHGRIYRGAGPLRKVTQVWVIPAPLEHLRIIPRFIYLIAVFGTSRAVVEY